MKKSLTRKLIISMLTTAFAVVALGTSTFAWFTNNTSVTASGMKVKAQASGGLLIATYDGSKTGSERFGTEGFKASAVAANNELTAISPVSTIDAKDWYYASAASVDSNVAATPSSGSKYTIVTSASSYYLKNDFAIATAGGEKDTEHKLAVSSLTISHTGAYKSEALNKALRVAVVFADNGSPTVTKVKFFAPGYNSTEADNSIKWTGVDSDTATATVNGFANIADSSDYVDLFDKYIPALSLVSIYVYYEGEDENCKTNNTVDGIDELSVSISFQAVEIPVVKVQQQTYYMFAQTSQIPTGKSATYQWKQADTADGALTNCTGEGKQADTYKAPVDGKYYACEITVDGKSYTCPVVKYVDPSATATVKGTSVEVSMKNVSNTVTYQWQVRDDNDPAHFANISGNASATTAKLTGLTSAEDGKFYRCIITVTDQASKTITSSVVEYDHID